MKDLTNIPEQYHILFQTDWNKGNDSKMSPLQRSELANLWLQFNRWELEQAKPKLQQKEILTADILEKLKM